MSIEALEGLSDEDLFNEANSDEAPADEAVVDAPEAEPEQDEQPRDEAGRFAAQAAENDLPKPNAAEPDMVITAKTPVDDNAAMVPSWRVREINEEKRTALAELETLRAERAQWQRPAPAPQPVVPPVQAERPDPLLDPEGFAKAVREEIREEMLSDRRETSLANAHRTYKGEFEEAYAAAQKQVDPVLRLQMQNSRDPGETLIQWHREQKTRAEVGTDLNAFRQREQERLLSDPAFLAKAIEKARGTAQNQQPGSRQASPVDIPKTLMAPSLNRVAISSADTSADDNDTSNEALWRHANA